LGGFWKVKRPLVLREDRLNFVRSDTAIEFKKGSSGKSYGEMR
jgi:hypothetical protein